MDEQAHNSRMLKAAVVCFILLAAYTLIFPPSSTETTPAEVATADGGLAPDPTGSGPAAPTATATSGAVMAAAAPTQARPERFTFRGRVETSPSPISYELELTNVGGGIERFELPEFKARDDKNAPTDDPIRLAVPSADEPDLSAQMAGLEFLEGTTFRLPPRPIYEVVEKGEDHVRYRYMTPEGVEIEREYKLDPAAFAIELAVTVRNKSASPQRSRMQISAAQKLTAAMTGGGFLFMPPPDRLNGTCFTDGNVKREVQKDLVDDPTTYDESVKWVGMDRQYFLAAIIQRDDAPASCRLSGVGSLARASLIMPDVTLKPGEETRHKFTAYLGVKKPELLTRVDSQLESAIDYTIMGMNLAILCEALLAILGIVHGFTGSWGFAILGLTVIVKGALFPLQHRSMRSMRAMSTLKPEIDALKEKYPEDRQRQSEEMMKLYRKHNVNPASGCVPMLLQMPIWFALYRALWVSVDLYQQKFLWIPDLTAQDPLWILPVLLVGVMFVQQRMTPSTMDPAQQKMMLYFMPLMFGFMMAALPAGLSFYILVNTLLTIVQQHLINRSVGPIGGSPSAREATA
jgi:YidC/Oxa1 family membrane protein insertase